MGVDPLQNLPNPLIPASMHLQRLRLLRAQAADLHIHRPLVGMIR